MAGVAVLVASVVSRFATLSPDVRTTAGRGAFDDAEATGCDAAVRCGRRPAESRDDGRGELRVGGADAATVAVSAGKPSRPIESAPATGGTKIDSAAVVPDSIVFWISPSPLPPHETAPARTSSTYMPHSCRDDEVSIAPQAITARATVRRSR
jgi:hypothetical protein